MSTVQRFKYAHTHTKQIVLIESKIRANVKRHRLYTYMSVGMVQAVNILSYRYWIESGHLNAVNYLTIAFVYLRGMVPYPDKSAFF